MRLEASNEVVLLVKLEINDGQRMQFADAVDRMTSVVERREPGLLRYQFHILDDGRSARAIHVYRDAAALDMHVQVAKAEIADVMQFASVVELEIVGNVPHEIEQSRRRLVVTTSRARSGARSSDAAYGFVR